MSSSDGTDESPRPQAKQVGRPAGSGEGADLSEGPCAIVEDTVVNSPDRNVAATIRSADVLQVIYDKGPPRVLRVVTIAGSTLGSLTPPSLPQIIACIEAGHSYIAVVIDVRGGRIAVQVRPS